MLVLVAETMSMRRGVPGGLRMAPAEAHDALGLIPLQFAGARGSCGVVGAELGAAVVGDAVVGAELSPSIATEMPNSSSSAGSVRFRGGLSA